MGEITEQEFLERFDKMYKSQIFIDKIRKLIKRYEPLIKKERRLLMRENCKKCNGTGWIVERFRLPTTNVKTQEHCSWCKFYNKKTLKWEWKLGLEETK